MSQTQEDINKIVLAEKPNLNFTANDGQNIKIISNEDEAYLDQKYEEMMEYMRTKHEKGLHEEEKDKLYGDLQIMWNEVSGKNGGRLNEVSFNLVLHEDEFKFLFDMIKNKFEYDVDTIFYAIELRDMLDDMEAKSKFSNDKQAIAFRMTPVDLHYLYHLVSKKTVKGLTKQSYLFAEIIKRIALSSTVFNYYKTRFDNAAKAVQLWVASLDPGMSIPETDRIYQLIWGDSDIKPDFSDSEDTKKSTKKSTKKVKEKSEN